MNDTTNTKIANDKGSNDPEVSLGQLLDKIKGINKEVDKVNKSANDQMSVEEAKISSTITDIKGDMSNLDKANKEAEDTYDSVILEQIDELDKEESNQKE